MALIDRGDSEKEYQDRTEFIPMKSIGFMSREKPHPIDWDKLLYLELLCSFILNRK